MEDNNECSSKIIIHYTLISSATTQYGKTDVSKYIYKQKWFCNYKSDICVYYILNYRRCLDIKYTRQRQHHLVKKN